MLLARDGLLDEHRLLALRVGESTLDSRKARLPWQPSAVPDLLEAARERDLVRRQCRRRPRELQKRISPEVRCTYLLRPLEALRCRDWAHMGHEHLVSMRHGVHLCSLHV